MKWLDLVSSDLKKYHQTWVAIRGSRKAPHVKDFNKYVELIPEEISATIIVSDQSKDCVFRSIGSNIAPIYPSCDVGMRFSQINPLPERARVFLPYKEVIISREPEATRGTAKSLQANFVYEQLLLPFIDDRFNVKVIDTVVDGHLVLRE